MVGEAHKIEELVFDGSVTIIIGSLPVSNHNDDGNKNPINLHI